jgi:hypothetical protein
VIDRLVLATAALLWAMVMYQSLHVQRHPADASVRILWLTFLALAVAATFFVPAVHFAAGRATGVANIAEPIARSAVLAAAFSAQNLLLHLALPTGPSRRARRWRWLVLACTTAVLWTFFVLAPVDTATSMFTRDFGSSPYVIAYLAVFLVYLGFALVDVIRQCRRYGTAAEGPLASGLRLIALGCLLGLGYVGTKATFLVTLALDAPGDGSAESTLARTLAVSAGALVALGCVSPALGALAASALSWLRAYRTHWRLYALWAAMYSVSPEIALDPASSRLRDALRLRDVAFRLYRRVIEIRDGRLALRPFLDEAIAHDSMGMAMRRGLRGDEADAAAEAVLLATAIRAQRAGARAEHPLSWAGTSGSSYPEELEWLTRVARHFCAQPARPRSLAAPAPAALRTKAP